MQKLSRQTVSAVVGMSLASPIAAHHGTSQFIGHPDLALNGIVTAVRWENPHVYLEIRTLDELGRTETWRIEGRSPDAMAATGLPRDTFAVGKRITIAARSSRDPTTHIARFDLLLAQDEFRNGNLSVPSVPRYTAHDIDDVWVLAQTSENFATLVKFKEPGAWWPITEAGRVAIGNSTEGSSSDDDCISAPWPVFREGDGPLRIEINSDAVLLERGSSQRRIHMNVGPHENANDSELGHSVGHWEGSALVIDTSNFLQDRNGHGDGLASSVNKRLVERFELTEDRARMIYAFWVDDPEYLTERIRGTFEFVRRPDVRLESVSCDARSLSQRPEVP